MGRKAGDGRGRLGGRAAGTPNKEKPLKTFLREHSLSYFTPNIEELDEKKKPSGRMVSQFDLDIQALDPASRVDAEVKLLKFHTPQMQTTSVDVTAVTVNTTIANRLSRLAKGEEINAPDDE